MLQLQSAKPAHKNLVFFSVYLSIHFSVYLALKVFPETKQLTKENLCMKNRSVRYEYNLSGNGTGGERGHDF